MNEGKRTQARFTGVLAIFLPWHRRAAECRPALGAYNFRILLEPCADVEGAETALPPYQRRLRSRDSAPAGRARDAVARLTA